MIVDGSAGGVDRSLLKCKRQSFFIFIKCKKFVIRIILADRFGDRSSDQSESDEADTFCSHSLFLVFLPIRHI